MLHSFSPVSARRSARRNSGFTLIEIMIVVLIIGILLAIAVPNFVRARESSRAKACVANLQQIQSAKEQWAMDNKKTGTDSPTAAQLFGTGNYVVATPLCPATGAGYTIGNVDTNPVCPNPGTVGDVNYHGLP